MIHGDLYAWTYVERLYNMLDRCISHDIRLHVYTEADRPVPAPMIKHELPNWDIGGAKLGWWYKMQLFDPAHHSGPLLYFDLDTVIIDNIDWICDLPSKWFWTVRDFKYLWRPTHQEINSSIMWWDTTKFSYVWQDFQQHNLNNIIKQYRGDQNYLNKVIDNSQVRFLDSDRIKSWRWECLDGGRNFRRRFQKNVVTATSIPPTTDVLIFHGQPKPAEVTDAVVLKHWQ